jgi:hypothetical protein
LQAQLPGVGNGNSAAVPPRRPAAATAMVFTGDGQVFESSGRTGTLQKLSGAGAHSLTSAPLPRLGKDAFVAQLERQPVGPGGSGRQAGKFGGLPSASASSSSATPLLIFGDGPQSGAGRAAGGAGARASSFSGGPAPALGNSAAGGGVVHSTALPNGNRQHGSVPGHSLGGHRAGASASVAVAGPAAKKEPTAHGGYTQLCRAHCSSSPLLHARWMAPL